MFEVGETVFNCVLETCQWSTSIPIFAPPEGALADIFGPGAMSLQAKHHHDYEAERIVGDHYATHGMADFVTTIMQLRRELEAVGEPAVCGHVALDTGACCLLPPGHSGRRHAGYHGAPNAEEGREIDTWT